MKKALLILTALLFVVLVKAQEINNEQWTVITKRTATWCTFCGQYGWDMFEGLQEEFTEEDDVLLIAAHYSGDLQNDAATDIVANFGGSGQPTFFLNNDNMFVTSGNVNAKIQEARQTVDLLNSFDPFAGIGIEATDNGNMNIEVNAAVEFMTDLSGDFYLGLYEINNNIIANQASQGLNTLHKKVLTRQIIEGEGSFGKLISSGDVGMGDKIMVEANFDLIDEATEDLEVAAILWNKVGNDYLVFNAYVTDIAMVSGTDEVSFLSSINTYQVDDNLILNFNSDKKDNNASISIVGIDGQNMLIENLIIAEGSNQKLISTNGWSSGVYAISIRTDQGITTRKVVIR